LPDLVGPLQSRVAEREGDGAELLRFGDVHGNIVDGTSNTLFFGEKHVRLGRFGEAGQGDGSIYNGDLINNALRGAGTGNLLALTPTESVGNKFGSWHPGVVQFVFGDGSVRAIPVSISGSILNVLAQRDDGMPIPNF
jgi:prepilin-type processing-associated H-X9-DG protein